MRVFTSYLRSRFRIFSLVSVVALAALLLTPRGTIAQQEPAPAAAPATAPAAAAPKAAEPQQATETRKSEEEQEDGFLHAPIVQSVAKLLHLPVETTINLLLGINFAIIFFAIVIPLFRIMPKVIRKRSQSVRQGLETARAATTDAQSRLSAVEAKLAGLGEEMKAFRAQVEQESLGDEKRIKASIGEESARIVAAAGQEITSAAAQAKRGLRNFAADLAVDQASKQLTLTPEADRALIAEFVSGVAGEAGQGGKN